MTENDEKRHRNTSFLLDFLLQQSVCGEAECGRNFRRNLRTATRILSHRISSARLDAFGGLVSNQVVTWDDSSQFPRGAVPVVRPGLGWDVAAGADYRFAGTPWHKHVPARIEALTRLE